MNSENYNWKALLVSKLPNLTRKQTVWLVVTVILATTIVFAARTFAPSSKPNKNQSNNSGGVNIGSIGDVQGDVEIQLTPVEKDDRSSNEILTSEETKTTKFAFISPAERFGATTSGILNNENVQIAYVPNDTTTKCPTYYVEGAYVIEFKIQKRPEFKNIAIDRIRAVVHSWNETSPPKIHMGARRPSETSLYLVSINKPPANKTSVSFIAEHFFEPIDQHNSEKKKFSPRVIDSVNPELVHVRVDSMIAGDFTLSIEIDISRDMQTETIEVFAPSRIVFVEK